MANFNIENLVGSGLTAVITDGGAGYSSYRAFAEAAGYPDAVGDNKDDSIEEVGDRIVKVLAKGTHEDYDRTIYVIETKEGERFLIGARGITIIDQPEPDVIERMQKEIAELKTKVAALEGASKPKSFIRQAFEECQGEAEEAVKKFLEEAPKTPQQIRNEIVERAKADVAELLETGTDCEIEHPRDTPFYGEFYDVDFVVNKEKRTVVSLVYLLTPIHGTDAFTRDFKTPTKIGIAKADPSDCFNVHLGKAIALRRALGIEVPAEYYNAPAPTEVRVGDVVSGNNDETYYKTYERFTLTGINEEDGGFYYAENPGDWIDESQIGEITDDSREC